MEAWRLLTDLGKKKQALAVALSFEQGSEVRRRVFNDIELDELKENDGLDKLLVLLDKWYKKDTLSGAYGAWKDFEFYAKKDGMTFDDYILGYQTRCKALKKHKIAIPSCVLAFKLLEYSGLAQRDRTLVLTAVNYDEPDTLLDQTIEAIRKFFGRGGVNESEKNGVINLCNCSQA